MGAVTLPFNIHNGDDLDADRVMGNDQTIASVVNGGLQATSNVVVGPAATQKGQQNLTGVSSSLAAADHSHIIQGFENRTADPTTGNFVGRVFYNTATNKLRYCTNAAGSGTFADLTPDALTLVLHAAQHKDGGHDPLADNTITDHMFAPKGTIFSATMPADISPLSAASWTVLLDMTGVTTTGIQTLGVSVSVMLQTAGGGGSPNATISVQDITAGGTPVIWMGEINEMDAAVQTEVKGFFFYTTPAGGARTLRLRGAASSNVSGGVIARAPGGFNGNAVVGPNLSAVIL